ncbi:MAG: toxin-antitoxin system HicB family antitoxin [Pyrinomonadaceae bacterium]
MNAVKEISIPESLLRQIKELTDKEGITVEQFINSAAAEKASAWMTLDYLRKRAKRGSREKFLKIMEKVPDVEPNEDDRLP